MHYRAIAWTLCLGLTVAARDAAAQSGSPTVVCPPTVERLPPVYVTTPVDPVTFDPYSVGRATPSSVAPATAAPAPVRLEAGPFGGTQQSPLRIGGFWASPQDVSGQDSTLEITGQDVNVGVPIPGASAADQRWIALFTFDHRHLATNAILPDSGLDVPEDLWYVTVGVMHMRELANGKKAGGMLTFGSASDHPFEAGRDLTYSALAFLTVPAHNPRDDWSFSVFYSPTSQIPYPLPGLAYVWRPSPVFQANIGLPALMVYRPTPTRTITASYTPLWNVKVEWREQLDLNWTLFAGYQTDTDIYFLSEREENDQRFYLFEQRATLGLERQLAAGFVLDLALAWLFDRELFQARGFSDDRTDELSIGSGPAALLQVRWLR